MFTIPITNSDAARTLMREQTPAAGIVFQQLCLNEIFQDQDSGLCTVRLRERSSDQRELCTPEPFLDIDGSWIKRDSYENQFELEVSYRDSEREFLRRLSI